MVINGREGTEITVLLIDDDRDFRNRFSTYIATNCSNIMLSVSDSARAAGWEEDPGTRPDLILIDARSELLDGLIHSVFADRTVVLHANEKEAASMREKDVRSVFKFLSAPSLISSVPELAESFEGYNLRRKRADDVSVIAVTGYFGGCGKTAFSLMLSRLNQQIGKRSTLVISTDRFTDLDEFFPYPYGEISDINLLLLNFLSGFKIVPSRFLLQDPHGVCAIASPLTGSNDIRDLSREDMRRFLDLIRQWNMFDTVVFDLGRGAHDADRAVLESAERIYVLHDARRSTIRSERRWIEKLHLVQERSVFSHVMNYSDYRENDLGRQNSGSGLTPEHSSVYDGQYEIPYDPDSFSVRDGLSDLSMTGRYANAVSYILKGNEFVL